MTGCHICPRNCGLKRTESEPGWCGVNTPPGFFRLGKIMAHHGEEPFISGTRGSGTLFFSGCALGCTFCQNYPISHRQQGEVLSANDLLDRLEPLIKSGVHNLNWVTASHYTLDLLPVIQRLHAQGYTLPMIWNTSAYESVETLRELSAAIQIYLPDFKFWSPELSSRLAHAPDYARVAGQAIQEMLRQQPHAIFTDEGLMVRGVALRHLVLPGQLKDACQVIDYLAATVPLDLPLSLMSQYTPFPDLAQQWINQPELNRRLTTYEYKKVVDHAGARGFTRILTQHRSSATAAWTPDF